MPDRETGPLFTGGPAPTRQVEGDDLWHLLAEGRATAEDQRYAAGWIAMLTQPQDLGGLALQCAGLVERIGQRGATLRLRVPGGGDWVVSIERKD